ncbi:transcriptional regulator [Streptomyces sp. G-5]|uniref:transcriptional regulator n=1 Tax=Streptomyces sp. G-5 TaxID=2977231 RepID=UPI0021D078DD|nr:transcriptional regulator [Streptomyces sp. G-5]MCU4750263.1 transcriptional regulator [Streptomyces sp. G-5]
MEHEARVGHRAVNRQSGEIVQLELLGGDALQNLRRTVPVRYDWRPHPGRHVNVAKALMAKVWHKDSGYTQNDRDILGFYVAHSPEAAAPLRMTFKEISAVLGVRQDTVRKSVERLHSGGLLLEAEKIGRVRFFRINPRAAFDGSATAQVEATKEARHPVVPAPADPTKRRKAS